MPSSLFPTLALGAWLCMPAPARAGGEEADIVVVNTALFSAVAGTGGLVTIIGNSVNLARRTPDRGWPISGYVLGPLNVIVGSLWFALFRVETPLYAIGGSLIGIGLTDIGLSIAGHVRHVQAAAGPFQGNAQPAGGAGLRVSF